MKKIYIYSFLLILSATNIISQSGWFWQNPLPQGHHLSSVQFLNDQTGHAVGQFGTLLKTTNGGLNWNNQIISSDKSFYTLFFFNSNTGFVAGKKEQGFNWTGIILGTTDGGLNWEVKFEQNSIDINSFCFIDSSTGYASATSGLILKTVDGGNNWIVQNTGFTNYLNSVFFIQGNTNTGFAAGSNGRIIKTTNGGLSWYNLTQVVTFIRFTLMILIQAMYAVLTEQFSKQQIAAIIG